MQNIIKNIEIFYHYLTILYYYKLQGIIKFLEQL